ncbi:glycerophosphodiester phosphodiesterase [Neobacillus mesonae]|nr:glycerophosphodiester phosphodiesterase [Neobacillus mesonae]
MAKNWRTLLIASMIGIAGDTDYIAAAHSAPTAVIAHRGAAGYAPENTMASFELAYRMKSDMIELDVQRSRDGELVVIHDLSVDRTTNGTGEVRMLTLAELRGLDAGGWFGGEFSGQQIPSFEEVLAHYSGKGIGFLIELKAPELYPGIERQVADALIKYGYDQMGPGQVILQSFNQESMAAFHEMLPTIPTGVLIEDPADLTSDKLDEYRTYASYVNPHVYAMEPSLVDQIHARGMKVYAWTLRKREDVEFLLDMGVDGIITDYPDYVPYSERK